MSMLKDKLAGQIPGLGAEIKDLIANHGDQVISQVTIKQAYGGVRGVKCLVCDTSEVPPDKGLLIRNTPVAELADRLPEEILWLLLTGELPSKAELADLQKDLKARAKVPQYVWDVLEKMPKDSHPMAMFDTAILVMQRESKFAKAYAEGAKKPEYWIHTLEDLLDIVAKLPSIAAGVYRLRFNKGPRIESDPSLDWSGDYVHMMGLGDPGGKFTEAMRLYFVLHTDHESGNVSAHTTHCVASALSDLYYALSAGLNGLAGPLHGLANQECLRWVLEVKEKFGGVPSKEDLEKFAWDTLKSGQVIPGYGHAVLRVTDPRFDCFLNWAKKNIGDDPIVQLVGEVFDVVPGVLRQVQKIADPWPNVDAGSGGILYHFGITEFPYYTVLFSVSRALGVCSQAVISRAMGYPIER
ncbi:MAG: citrate (Si)-synthase, partial [bacterium]